MCAWQAPGSLETWSKWRNLGEKGKFLGGDKIDPDAPSLSGFSPSQDQWIKRSLPKAPNRLEMHAQAQGQIVQFYQN